MGEISAKPSMHPSAKQPSMPIRLTCQCGKSLSAKDDMAGKRAKCPACGTRIEIPTSATANFDVFISHSHDDKSTADAICATLEAKQVRCWIAPRDIVPGQEWGEAIIEGINACSIMVLVYSSASNGSKQVRREVERAINRGAILIPFRIENVPMSKTMEFFLSSHHWLDALTPPLEAHLEALTTTVRSLLKTKNPNETLLRADAASGPAMKPKPAVANPSPSIPAAAPEKSASDDANAASERAGDKARVQDWQGAIAEMSCAIRFDDGFAKAYNSRAFYHLMQNALSAAIVDSNEAIRLAPGDAGFFEIRALIKKVAGDMKGAITDLDEALRLGPETPNRLVSRAICKVGFDMDGAIGDATRAIELDPKDSLSHGCRGALRCMKGDWIAAIADCDKALSLDGNNQNAFENRGNARLQVGDLDGALSDCNQAIQIQATSNAHANRGFVKQRLGDLNGALSDFAKALELNPNAPGVLRNRGVTRLLLQDFEGAMSDYNAALQQDPNDVGSYVQRAIVWWFHCHDEANARADTRKALELNPRFPIPAGLPR